MKKNRKTKARHYPVSPEQDHPEMPASSDTRSEDTKLLLHCLERFLPKPVLLLALLHVLTWEFYLVST